jgi:hypothetical protein
MALARRSGIRAGELYIQLLILSLASSLFWLSNGNGAELLNPRRSLDACDGFDRLAVSKATKSNVLAKYSLKSPLWVAPRVGFGGLSAFREERPAFFNQGFNYSAPFPSKLRDVLAC